MSVAPDPLTNLEHAVSLIAQVEPGQRLPLVKELMRGPLDYSKEPGRTIGTRRALLITRLRERGLWPA